MMLWVCQVYNHAESLYLADFMNIFLDMGSQKSILLPQSGRKW
jgi:hypothetical protein